MTEPIDLRPFVAWITDGLVPSTRCGPIGHHARRVGGTVADVYGVADVACILWSIGDDVGRRDRWLDAFTALQDPTTGAFVEREPSHLVIHATAFSVAAMELLDLEPAHPLRVLERWHDVGSIEPWLAGLDWERYAYLFSHEGAGVASLAAIRPRDFADGWLDGFFRALDGYLDPATGMHGRNKPAAGDLDQIGATFHYAFVHEHCDVELRGARERIDAILGLQRPDGLWDPDNPWWLTLDAVYLLSRGSRQVPERRDRVDVALRSAAGWLADHVADAETCRRSFGDDMGVHAVTAAVSAFAVLQAHFGPDEVVTDEPLRLVLDRRPFV